MPPLLTQIARLSDGLPLVALMTPGPSLPVTPQDQQQAKQLVRKITSSQTKMSIDANDGKTFCYMTRESLCFLVMTESKYPKRLASGGGEIDQTARPFRFIHYDPAVQRKQKEFQDERLQRSKLNDDLSEIQSIMKKNITDILDRGEKLDNVQNISQDLMSKSSNFKWGTRKLTLQARIQQYAPIIVIVLIVLFVVYVKFFW
eukprot:CAMPEP_0113517772 /NCGR_PEP_ID=MMETSP0014_2-20120614/42456_1 /TAXON_ID=2857 /ORGANISM="Nitzschia sp." /LENGTH=201 /DNA_ID=CAMNT_0000415029 /DNA_START=371 /DNA_END=975 /DNA_ORIENTATION=- /assembly_acc=CAM_ASM_000159